MADDRNNGFKKWVIFSGVAFQMGIIIAIGAYSGVYLDKKYPNKYSAFTVILSLAGVFLALYTVIKQVAKMNKEDKDSDS